MRKIRKIKDASIVKYNKLSRKKMMQKKNGFKDVTTGGDGSVLYIVRIL